MGVTLDRTQADVEQRGRLRLGQLEVVAAHDDLTLASREGPHGGGEPSGVVVLDGPRLRARFQPVDRVEPSTDRLAVRIGLSGVPPKK